MKRVYPVIFTQTNDKKDTILIEVPDFDIVTEGFGIMDAIYMARDAIGLKGIVYEDSGMEIPQSSSMSEISKKEGVFDEEGTRCISLVDIDFSEYRLKDDLKMVKRIVRLPNWLNREAEKANINVSALLREALMARLNVSKR